MGYDVTIQLCDDDSVITNVTTEVENIEQGEQLVTALTTAMESFFLNLHD